MVSEDGLFKSDYTNIRFFLQEKHRTCQQEVANRDQVIIKLQTELDTQHQQYNGCVEEVRNILLYKHDSRKHQREEAFIVWQKQYKCRS